MLELFDARSFKKNEEGFLILSEESEKIALSSEMKSEEEIITFLFERINIFAGCKKDEISLPINAPEFKLFFKRENGKDAPFLVIEWTKGEWEKQRFLGFER